VRYIIGKSERLDEIEFEEGINRPLSQRIDNCFIKTYKPVMDDVPYRIFDKMCDYRKWCKENLPDFLGYNE
jgi:hypothetical protein